ncbi:hypothetical protein BS78_08G134700, partial [Paspalum vaginatum]
MESPWVILGRGAEAMDVDEAPEPSDFFPTGMRPPPAVNILVACRGAHPDADNPDEFPYIIAAGPFGFLTHFAVAPHYGTCFQDKPPSTHLVLVSPFYDNRGMPAATAERVPDRPGIGIVPALEYIASVGILFDGVHEIIAELQVDHGGDHATLVRFRGGQWTRRGMDCPLPEVDDRDWVPHGAVSDNTSICWFDLSWGILSCDLNRPEAELALHFHHLPGGRALDEATPDIHSTRCVTVTQDGKLRYVEIIREAAPPTVTMWTWFIGDHGWEWFPNYSVSFELIWNDDSYKATGLPRGVVPVLTAVSPANHHVVYFALEQNIFGVDVPMHRVEHWAPYNLVNVPGPQPPASGRFLIPWTLP